VLRDSRRIDDSHLPRARSHEACYVGSQSYTQGMTFSAAEFYEAGMSLPPDVRKHVALRLLESVDPDEAFDLASESWLRTEAAAAYDALKADPSRAIPAEVVRAEFEAKWAARS
jgi:hypothetical protein